MPGGQLSCFARNGGAAVRGRKLNDGIAASRSRRSRCPAKVRPSYTPMDALLESGLTRRTGEPAPGLKANRAQANHGRCQCPNVAPASEQPVDVYAAHPSPVRAKALPSSVPTAPALPRVMADGHGASCLSDAQDRSKPAAHPDARTSPQTDVTSRPADDDHPRWRASVRGVTRPSHRSRWRRERRRHGARHRMEA